MYIDTLHDIDEDSQGFEPQMKYDHPCHICP